ncbi:MAG: ATP-binding cassette domain-containing protein [Dehalococcoidia bacterium]|nr:MAG: ATP-binding cassette domain-containing protein [Dehalococcoidia bacterium]
MSKLNSNTLAIQIFALTKRFDGLMAVDSISLEIRRGELFSLLGPNGAGKTTTINILCCLLKPTSGTASIMGYDIMKEPFRVKELIGVAPQETTISEHLNSWENLSLIGRVHRIDSKELRKRSEELLETVGLLERAKDRVGKFSGGMKRRLNLIMALVPDPEILFLDEPTLGLDPQSRRAIWDYIAELKGKKTILLTTHYLEEADVLSDRVGIIDEGKIVALGTPDELKKKISDTNTMIISAENLSAEAIDGLRTMDRYAEVDSASGNLRVSGKDLNFREIMDYLHSQGIVVRSAALEQPTLEDVFLQITGKELRE